MPRYCVIVNPTSGRGTGGRMIPVIERIMKDHGLDFDLIRTERPWHAAELAYQAVVHQYDYVVAAGGDGTVNEVVNGLMRAKQENLDGTALSVLCVGRGNDFAYSLGLPHELNQAVETLAVGRKKWIDIGRLQGGLFPQGRWFSNGVGIGFDAVVGFESVKLTPLSGFTSYLVATLKTILLYYHAPKVQIELDDETIVQPALMVSIMNGRRMGGGFQMAPGSKPDDGQFDLCIAGGVSRLEILRLIPRFLNGTQAGHPAIQFRKSRRVKVTALNGSLPAHADGETMALTTDCLEMEALPGVVELVVP
jgi:diacylglycerol kinase (ATP)